jgi:hypothetical protein
MTWISKPMTSDCIYYFTQVRKFTLVRETPKALRIRLEDHPKKISIWMPKKITREYTGTSAWFWSTAFHNNVQEEEQKLRDQKENTQIVFKDFNALKTFNAVHVDKPTNKDVKKIEKIIDSEEEEKRKDAEADEQIHSWNPNKGYWKN